MTARLLHFQAYHYYFFRVVKNNNEIFVVSGFAYSSKVYMAKS